MFKKSGGIIAIFLVLGGILYTPGLPVLADSELPELSLQKWARNVSEGTGWQESVSAEPNQDLEFKIEVSSIGTERARDVWLRDELPSGIFYEGPLMSDGIRSSWDITNGFNMGNLDPGQTRVFSFAAKVGFDSSFTPGSTTDLVNTAMTWAFRTERKEDTAQVSVWRSGETVLPPAPPEQASFSVSSWIRNLSDGTSWQDIVLADPNEKLGFKIEVKAAGAGEVKDVVVKNVLPGKVSYFGNLQVNGTAVQGDILQGLAVGNLFAGETKIITFDAMVSSKDKFGYGTTNLVNTVLVSSDQEEISYTNQIMVTKKEVSGATEIPTGILNNKVIDYFLLPLLMTLVLILVFNRHLVLVNNWVETKRTSVTGLRSKIELKRMIDRFKPDKS